MQLPNRLRGMLILFAAVVLCVGHVQPVASMCLPDDIAMGAAFKMISCRTSELMRDARNSGDLLVVAAGAQVELAVDQGSRACADYRKLPRRYWNGAEKVFFAMLVTAVTNMENKAYPCLIDIAARGLMIGNELPRSSRRPQVMNYDPTFVVLSPPVDQRPIFEGASTAELPGKGRLEGPSGRVATDSPSDVVFPVQISDQYINLRVYGDFLDILTPGYDATLQIGCGPPIRQSGKTTHSLVFLVPRYEVSARPDGIDYLTAKLTVAYVKPAAGFLRLKSHATFSLLLVSLPP